MFILSDKNIQKFEIVEILSHGGIVIMPCDTIYGFVGIAPDTAEKLNRIKKRSQKKGFLQLILSDWLSDFSSKSIEPSLASLCPGKLTFIVQSRGGATTAVRVPEDPFLVDLLESIGKPLYSTSVNRSGEAILFRSSDIINEFGSEADAFIDAGDLPNRKPSTIIDITSRPYKIIRSGACSVPDAYLTE